MLRKNRLILLVFLFVVSFSINLSRTQPIYADENISEADPDRMILLISGYPARLGIQNMNADVSPPFEDWGTMNSHITQSSSEINYLHQFLVDNLDLPSNKIIIFSYAGPSAYEQSNGTYDYTKPLYKIGDTEPCPTRVPGGGCPEEDGTIMWDRWSEYINALLTQFPNTRFDIIGHSMGGAVALYWAGKQAQNPDSRSVDRVNSIITINSPLTGNINTCKIWNIFGSRKLYSDAAGKVIKTAPMVVPNVKTRK